MAFPHLVLFVFPGGTAGLFDTFMVTFCVTDLEASARGLLTEVADFREHVTVASQLWWKPCCYDESGCRLPKNSERLWNQAMRKL